MLASEIHVQLSYRVGKIRLWDSMGARLIYERKSINYQAIFLGCCCLSLFIYKYIYIYIYIYIIFFIAFKYMKNAIFTTFSQQILNSKLLFVLIGGQKCNI